MALSKAQQSDTVLKRLADPWIELYIDSVDSMQPVIDLGTEIYNSSSCRKKIEAILEPWIELCDDSLDAIQIFIENSKWFYKTFIPASVKLLVNVTSLKICDHPLTKSLRELLEDGGSWIPLISSMALCGSSSGVPIFLAGAALTKKLFLSFIGGCVLFTAHTYHERSLAGPKPARAANRRAVFGMVVTSFVYFGLAAGGLDHLADLCGFSDQFAMVSSQVSHPFLFVMFCKDLVVCPLMLINIQFLSGVPTSQVVAPVLINSVGSALAAASFTTLVGIDSQAYFNYGAAACMILTTGLMSDFDRHARTFGNGHRSGNAVYGTVLWWAPAMAVLVAREGGLDLEGIEPAVLIFDAFAKAGVNHITLKERTSLELAARHEQGATDMD